MERQCLTPPESATIIANLFAEEVREKRLARRVVGLQMAVTLIATGIAYSLEGAMPYAKAVLGGGLVSVVNGALLAWRMSRAALHPAPEAPSMRDAHHQLRLLYYYAAERFLVVAALLGVCMVALKMSPLPLLGGFVMGQAALMAGRLILNRLLSFDRVTNKNV